MLQIKVIVTYVDRCTMIYKELVELLKHALVYSLKKRNRTKEKKKTMSFLIASYY